MTLNLYNHIFKESKYFKPHVPNVLFIFLFLFRGFLISLQNDDYIVQLLVLLKLNLANTNHRHFANPSCSFSRPNCFTIINLQVLKFFIGVIDTFLEAQPTFNHPILGCWVTNSNQDLLGTLHCCLDHLHLKGVNAFQNKV